MLATRPILLYTLIQSRIPGSGNKDTAPSNTHTLKTLGDACINAARHTHALIVEEWTNGSMPIFGYFYAHYLFSCALIMVVRVRSTQSIAVTMHSSKLPWRLYGQ